MTTMDFAAILLVAAACIVLASSAFGHDDGQWVADQNLKDKIGVPCCGPDDCRPTERADFRATDRGYLIVGGELIPYGEVSPLSPDGRLWVCRAKKGGRRCVFGPQSVF